MRSWARRVLTSDYTSDATWKYMDKVGIMHTGVKSFKHRAQTEPLVVPCTSSKSNGTCIILTDAVQIAIAPYHLDGF